MGQRLEPDSPLRKNADLDLATLQERIAKVDEAIVYRYKLTTLALDGGRLVQTGCGPNIEGGRVTLCTCKHQMRTVPDLAAWNEGSNIWVAGFSSVRLTGGQSVLFYLMRVEATFDSHLSLWRSPEVPEATKHAKSARRNIRGDVFEPRSGNGDRFTRGTYHDPVSGHVHELAGSWHKDINYLKGYAGRQPVLLMGDPAWSFVWTKPMLRLNKGKLPRNYDANRDLRQFVRELCEP